MPSSLEHEEQAQLDHRQSSDLSTRDESLSFVWRALPRIFAFLVYVVVVVALVATLLEFASWIAWSFHPVTRQAEQENQRGSPVYAGVDWAREFWQEESVRQKQTKAYVSFRLWSVTEWHSKYINNDQGVRGFWRRTINPANCDPAHRTSIWTFGGSTMYGTAVPDWATIPSFLSRDLNTGSRDCVMVSNFGVEGYVTDQELILLTEQLKAGGHPDIVIFYDGVNDSSLAWPPSRPPDAHFSFGTIKARVEGSASGRFDFFRKSYAVRLAGEILARLRPARSYATLIAQTQPNILATVDNYQANMRLVRVLGDAYRFKLYCFWQPMIIYGHKPLVPFEQQMVTRDASGTTWDSAWFLTNAAAYREAEHRAASGADFVFLGDVFDSTQEAVYVDEAHLGPRGNEIMAQAIASYIQDHPAH